MTVLYVALSPLLVMVALVVDVVRPRRWALLRLWAFLLVYLCAELIGVAMLTGLWIASRFSGGRERLADWTYAMQAGWVASLWRALSIIFGLRWDVEGLDVVRPGPIVMLVRHTSLVDTVIPTTFVSRKLGMRMRFVLKRELLGDPCLDIAGHFIPNVFVDRGAEDSAPALAAIARLADGLGRNEGALIYPEGTLFSPSKLAKIKAAVAERRPELAALVGQFEHVLPPRPAGTLALLGSASQADVVVCAHEGLGGLGKARDLLSGALVGRTVTVRFWRIPRADVPRGEVERTQWLHRCWHEVDTWVGQQAALSRRG